MGMIKSFMYKVLLAYAKFTRKLNYQLSYYQFNKDAMVYQRGVVKAKVYEDLAKTLSSK